MSFLLICFPSVCLSTISLMKPTRSRVVLNKSFPCLDFPRVRALPNFPRPLATLFSQALTTLKSEMQQRWERVQCLQNLPSCQAGRDIVPRFHKSVIPIQYFFPPHHAYQNQKKQQQQRDPQSTPAKLQVRHRLYKNERSKNTTPELNTSTENTTSGLLQH